MDKQNFNGIVKGEEIIESFTQIQTEINSLVTQSNNLTNATINISNNSDRDNSPLTLGKLANVFMPIVHGKDSYKTVFNIRIYTTTPHIDSDEIISFIPKFQVLTINSNGIVSECNWHNGLFITGYKKYLNVSVDSEGVATFEMTDTPIDTMGVKVYVLDLVKNYTTGLQSIRMIQPNKSLLNRQTLRRSNQGAIRLDGKIYGVGYRTLNESLSGISNRVKLSGNTIQDVSTYSQNNAIVYPSIIPLGLKDDTDNILPTIETLGIDSPIRKTYWELIEESK